MQIHTVKKDETLYEIARKYSIPATKILADNDLPGDRLTTGDELVILKPTKTIAVKGGDTLDGISKRFGVRKSSIIRDNPSLFGRDRLRPGQILTVKQDERKIGCGSVLGYTERGCRREKLAKSLPYLTYVTISNAVIRNDSVIPLFSASDVKANAEQAGKTVLFGITDESRGEFLSSKEKYERVIDDAIRLAKERGYMGISISSREAAELYTDELSEFLLEMRKRLIGCNMILFTEAFSARGAAATEICDGGVFNLELTSLSDAVSAMKDFSARAESSKVFVKLTNGFKADDKPLSADEIKELCYRAGKELYTDGESLISSFEYVKYKTGRGENIRLQFPSLRYIKAKLEALCELGFIGIGCDIDSVPLSNLTMFNSLFARADYSLIQ